MNNKGQAFVEFVVLSSLVVGAILVTTRLSLGVLAHVTFNELIEMAHFCQIQGRSNCEFEFKQQAKVIGFPNLSTRFRVENSTSIISVQGKNNFGKTYDIESELNLDLQVK